GLFAAIGNTSDSLVNFTSSTASTKAGTYSIDVAHLATQGKVAGNRDLTAASTTITSGTSWSVTLNGTTPSTSSTVATVNLAAGTYSASELATLVQSAINGASNFSNSGAAVTASINSAGALEVKSNKYGSVSNVSITSLTGTAASDIFGTSTSTDGTDISGSIGGLAATGSGQFLTGTPGSDANGLKLEITAGAIGPRGTVSFSQGYAYQLNTLASGFLGSTGLIAGGTDGLKASIKDIDKSRTAFNARLVDVEKRYRKEFTALDVAVQSMNSTATYLSQQLASIAKNN
ncbi:MAG: flagellar filament capping protein FliD, partial [Burkholderiales bacterium]|nr:flagellar filament capping protein FliD [Burkholderiales bacterium]